MAKADHIFVPHRLYTHHGIDIGDGTVIHLSRTSGQVCLVTLNEFSQGKKLFTFDWPECDDDRVVIERAFSRLDERGYSLCEQNCEHFASWCKTGVARSTQVDRADRRTRSFCGKVLVNGVLKLVGKSPTRGVYPALAAADIAQWGTEVFLANRGVENKNCELAGAGVGIASSVAIGGLIGGPVGACVGLSAWLAGETLTRATLSPSFRARTKETPTPSKTSLQGR